MVPVLPDTNWMGTTKIINTGKVPVGIRCMLSRRRSGTTFNTYSSVPMLSGIFLTGLQCWSLPRFLPFPGLPGSWSLFISIHRCLCVICSWWAAARKCVRPSRGPTYIGDWCHMTPFPSRWLVENLLAGTETQGIKGAKFQEKWQSLLRRWRVSIFP